MGNNRPQIVTEFAVKISWPSLHNELARWFMDQDGEIRTAQQIAETYLTMRRNTPNHPKRDNPVTKDDVVHAIAETRKVLELRHRTTLHNERGRGWKIATPDELAMYTARSVKRAILLADRTYRLVQIVDRNRIPTAIRVVFYSSGRKIHDLSASGRQYVERLVAHLEASKLEESHELVKRLPPSVAGE